MRPTLDKNREVILETTGEPKLSLQVRPKGDIRDITHLHHALDACVIGYASVLLPNNGKLWEQLVTRKVRSNERAAFGQMHGWNTMLRLSSPVDAPNEKTTLKLQVADLPAAFKNQIVERLKERRVVQHVPADMSGARLEQNTWGVVSLDGEQVTLRQRTFGPKDVDAETGARKRTTKVTKERASKLVGLKKGKLSEIKGALVINENYGVALVDEPIVIPFHDVKARLEKVRHDNLGNAFRVLRTGMVIAVKSGAYKGKWMIRSINNSARGVKVDMTDVQRVKVRVSGVAWAKLEVYLKPLIRNGLEIVDGSLCGVPNEFW